MMGRCSLVWRALPPAFPAAKIPQQAARRVVGLEVDRQLIPARTRGGLLPVGSVGGGDAARGVRLLHGSRASFGMFDSFTQSWQQMTEETMEQKKQEGFQFQVAYLLKQERVDLGTLKDIITQSAEVMGYKGWRKMMPGVESNPEVVEMKKHEKLIDACPTELKKDVGKIRGMEKIKLQKATGLTPQEINKTLKMYKEIEQLHRWLRKRAEAGKDIPKSTHQMLKMMLEPDGGMKRSMMAGKKPM